MGRPNINRKLLEDNGTVARNPDKYKNNPPKPSSSHPKKPLIISECEVASNIWDQTCSALDELGILSSSDTFIIEMYCTSYAEYLKLTRVIREQGYTSKGSYGTDITNPNGVAWDKAKASTLRFMSQLGLTPSARAKLDTPKKEDDISDADKMCKELGL